MVIGKVDLSTENRLGYSWRVLGSQWACGPLVTTNGQLWSAAVHSGEVPGRPHCPRRQLCRPGQDVAFTNPLCAHVDRACRHGSPWLHFQVTSRGADSALTTHRSAINHLPFCCQVESGISGKCLGALPSLSWAIVLLSNRWSQLSRRLPRE